MLGYLSYRELGEWAKNNRHRLSQEFNIIPERVPSYSTIRRVMMGSEWQSLLRLFNEWALSGQVFAEIIQGHWKIENQLHWVKDVIFQEDKSQISDFQAASNWSILTTMGLNLFRSLGFISITEGQRWLAERWKKLIGLST
ncbi:transposase [Microcystis aeruginosa NIES-3804]|uniref:Transposase n=1 Tax=Microcystis aeruginosa NIES-3804 TaxID=2517783 RepID=A0A6H9G903_MICAE|nr:transposase [Microcystis aeruginosa NIES-3804]